MPSAAHTPLRLLIVMPSWVGDAVMATPALRLIRSRFPGIFIGGLARPGIDELLAGTDFFDELHAERSSGVFGPKFVAAKLRPRRYDTALLLTNSFSTALIVRIAGINRRIGYDRDARGFLLTDRLEVPRRPDGARAPVPAVAYYWAAARALLRSAGKTEPAPAEPFGMPSARMELALTPEQDRAALELLERAGVADQPLAILNPGGNNPAKRWPPERFIAVGRHLVQTHGLVVAVNGSPGEAELAGTIAAGIEDACGLRGDATRPRAINLPVLGIALGSLKGVVRRARLMVTNDTGPRHIAAAFGVPVIALFGPTDPRWTTIPVGPRGELILVADPTLPDSELADDHPDRCRVDRIGLDDVLRAVENLLRPATSPSNQTPTPAQGPETGGIGGRTMNLP